MMSEKTLTSIEDLLGYAVAMEREAAARYIELADVMTVHNNQDVAEFFQRMAKAEQKHVERVTDIQRQLAPDARLRWRDVGGGEAPDRDEWHYLHQPYHAIMIALRFEKRAANFFAEVARTVSAKEMKEMASRLAEEEEGHVRELEKLLPHYPPPDEDWDFDPDPPVDQD